MTDKPLPDRMWLVDATIGEYGQTVEFVKASAVLGGLVKRAKALLDSVSHDDSGSMVAGQWVGGNGGLLSRKTLEEAQVLRLELDNWLK